MGHRTFVIKLIYMVIFLPLTPVTGSELFYEVPLLVQIPSKPEPSRYLSQKLPLFHVTCDPLVLIVHL